MTLYNPFTKIGGIWALIVTVFKLISRAWATAPGFITFIAANSPFFLGLAAGIAVAGWTRRFWVIIFVIALVYILLAWAGL